MQMKRFGWRKHTHLRRERGRVSLKNSHKHKERGIVPGGSVEEMLPFPLPCPYIQKGRNESELEFCHRGLSFYSAWLFLFFKAGEALICCQKWCFYSCTKRESHIQKQTCLVSPAQPDRGCLVEDDTCRKVYSELVIAAFYFLYIFKFVPGLKQLKCFGSSYTTWLCAYSLQNIL